MDKKQIQVPTMAEMAAKGESPEILFWVGCAGSFDDRYKKCRIRKNEKTLQNSHRDLQAPNSLLHKLVI